MSWSYSSLLYIFSSPNIWWITQLMTTIVPSWKSTCMFVWSDWLERVHLLERRNQHVHIESQQTPNIRGEDPNKPEIGALRDEEWWAEYRKRNTLINRQREFWWHHQNDRRWFLSPRETDTAESIIITEVTHLGPQMGPSGLLKDFEIFLIIYQKMSILPLLLHLIQTCLSLFLYLKDCGKR